MSGPYFSETLTALIGYSIGVFSGDGIILKGSLVDVKQDYLILQNEKGDYFYHHLDQIKSVSKNAKDRQTKKITRDFLRAENLHDILEQCKYSWVTINCHNDQMLTGFLSSVFEDHLILISGEETIIMQTAYINNIFQGFYERTDSDAANNSHENKEAADNETEDTKELNEKKERSASQQDEEKDVQNEDHEEKEEEGKEEWEASSEKKEERTEEKCAVTADVSPANKTIRMKKETPFDFKLSGRKLRLNITKGKKTAASDSKPSHTDDKKTQSRSADLSPEKDACVQKSRPVKKMKINKKDRSPQTEEKQSAAPTVLQITENIHGFLQPLLTQEEKERILEAQYYSLMKQAEKDYMKLRKKRLNREKMKK
ncbi:hypothetical protein BTO30_12930 [Domibacillus antri]|uniref:DUF2642 domain-containing protein n=1 Tax=Domibacillus antri TaxID=1714264 RepID=A0A1Q8Q325_9BACI|nr:DUF2642 domain-containing protein [Domibacillus antri]OLN21759.1 hypothetical protein BTO30_12930 [Domibacillus antri]